MENISQLSHEETDPVSIVEFCNAAQELLTELRVSRKRLAITELAQRYCEAMMEREQAYIELLELQRNPTRSDSAEQDLRYKMHKKENEMQIANKNWLSAMKGANG
jgi:hypothetical protein